MNWRSHSIDTLHSQLDQLVLRIEPRLPTLEDYRLPDDRKAALREIKQLIASALNPNDHGERAELFYLKARLLTELGQHHDAAFACRTCESEATQAFFDSKHSLWLELRWQRIRMLGEQQQWIAFEWALSEMIGWLANSSRRTDYGRDLSTVRYIRGLCYQLRGLISHEPDTTEALLVASLRDLEQVAEQEDDDKAIGQARERIADWQKEPGKARGVAATSTLDAIGLLGFRDWPRDTQAIFQNGANRTARGRFFEQKSPYTILFVLGFFLPFSIACAQTVINLHGPLSILGILAYAFAIIKIANAIRIVHDLCRYWKQKRVGAIVYGFLIDDETLAVRTIDAFSDYTYFFGKNSVLLSLGRIQRVLIGQKISTYGGSRPKTVDELIIRYTDKQGKLQQVNIPDRFELPVREIHHLLQALNHDLVGTWQAHYGNDTLHFDRESGTITNYGKTCHFRWKEIDGAAIAIVPFAKSDDGIQPGLYHFKINAGKGSSFELMFLEGFGGTSSRRFERSYTSAETAIVPTRVAMRLAASKPLPKLGLWSDRD